MISKQYVTDAASRLYDETVEIRRHLHRHPELSFEESATSSYVEERLIAMGIPYKKGYATHGIAAMIDSGREGRTIVLRADMDALPIEEDATHEVRSERHGVMHACGHDLHTASLLTTAKILNELKGEFAGRVMLIFQPGEECFPGGAKVMMEEGLFDGINPDVVIGAHVLPDMPVGHVGFCAGNYMASGDEIHLTVKGHGGHGGMPHLLTDNVLIACQLVVAMQQLVARVVPATIPAVLSFGKIIADGATNVIPDSVYIAGTMRTQSEEWRAELKKRIRTIAKGLTESFGATCDVDIKDGYPSVYNNPHITELAAHMAAELLGAERVEKMSVRMTAEDFGYYTQKYPSVFYRFGVARADGSTGGAHTAQFNPDEEALRTSPAVMAWIALKMLDASTIL